MKSSHLRMLLLLGALGLACSPESAFSQEKAAAQAYAGKTVTGEVTVKQTVEDTLQSHRGLKVMQENLDVVRHELRRAKAGWGPSVDAVGRTGASRLSNTTTRPLNADKDMYGANSISLTLTQPLWDGFATRSRVRTGEATVDSMTYRVLDNATSFALDAIIAHVDLLRRREILQLAKDNVRQHVELLDSQKERVELGAGSSADVTQTKGRLARAQSTLTDAEASLREGEASYIRLTGKPVPASLAEVYVPEPMYTGYDAVMEVADKNNPKLKAYMSDIKAARGEKELAESAYHPKINFEVGPSYSDRSGPGSQWTSGVDAGLVMRWNLFNSGADKAGTEAAESRTRMATETLYNFHDELALEIENTWTRYLAAKEQKKYYEEAIGYNTATRDAYLEQFKLGERSLLDVLDAVDGRVAHVHVRAGQVDLGAQRFFAVGKLTRAHTAEQVEVLLRRAVTVGARAAGLAGVVAAVLLHLLAGQVVHIGLALLDELLGVLVAALKIITAVENAAVRLGTQPFQVLQDALHVLVTLAGGVRVVKAQVEQAAVVFGDRVVDEDRLGGADMQVAVRLRRETGMHDIDLALGEVGIDNIRQEVGKFFVCHDYTPKLVSVTLL